MLLVRMVINAAALIAAALLVPQVHLRWGDEPLQTIVTLALLALLFALINSYVRPLLRILSLPVNLLTLGTFSFATNTGLLLLLAWLANIASRHVFTIGGFPPHPSAEALIGAVMASVVISVVSTGLSALIPAS